MSWHLSPWRTQMEFIQSILFTAALWRSVSVPHCISSQFPSFSNWFSAEPTVGQTNLNRYQKVTLWQSAPKTLRVASFFSLAEMHRTQTQYDNAFIFKVFIFQFVNFYSSPFYVAFFKGRWDVCPAEMMHVTKKHAVPSKISNLYVFLRSDLSAIRPTTAPCLGWEMKMWVYILPFNNFLCHCVFFIVLKKCHFETCFQM